MSDQRIPHPAGDDPATTFWDEVYSARQLSAQPPVNATLRAVVSPLPPGRALDLGCGAGGDAMWLAHHDWSVTAIDTSAVAIRHVDAIAKAARLAHRITATRHDLTHDLPPGGFDLISAQFLHSPFAVPRVDVFRQALRQLNVGGLLLVVDHGSTAPWSWDADPAREFPTPHDVAAELDIDITRWKVETAEARSRTATGPAGERADVVDHVLVVRRTAR